MKIHITNVMRAISLAVGGLVLAIPAWSQSADTVLVSGKILTVDNQFSTREAIAVRDGKIMVVGSNAEIRKLAGPQTRVIDLQGRTVIPGLIDSHMHAIRAGQTFSTEVNWVGATSLAEALGRIHEASLTMKPGSWLIVAGGWNVAQFKEKRRPTQADLVAAAPNNPVYIQLGYDWVVMTPAGLILRTALSFVSAMKRLPAASSARPSGALIEAAVARPPSPK